MKSDCLWGRESRGPFSILQACFGGHLGVVFCKIWKKWPLNGLQSMPEGWEMDTQIPCPIGNHFSWGLGYFARQTKLKWTKNFKALFLSLTKCNGNVFWRFVPEMILFPFTILRLVRRLPHRHGSRSRDWRKTPHTTSGWWPETRWDAARHSFSRRPGAAPLR